MAGSTSRAWSGGIRRFASSLLGIEASAAFGALLGDEGVQADCRQRSQCVPDACESLFCSTGLVRLEPQPLGRSLLPCSHTVGMLRISRSGPDTADHCCHTLSQRPPAWTPRVVTAVWEVRSENAFELVCMSCSSGSSSATTSPDVRSRWLTVTTFARDWARAISEAGLSTSSMAARKSGELLMRSSNCDGGHQ